jgi:hypothetical protein
MIENIARLVLLYAILKAVYEMGLEDGRREREHIAWRSGFRTGLLAGAQRRVLAHVDG